MKQAKVQNDLDVDGPSVGGRTKKSKRKKRESKGQGEKSG